MFGKYKRTISIIDCVAPRVKEIENHELSCVIQRNDDFWRCALRSYWRLIACVFSK